MNYIFNGLTFWVVASLITSMINFGLLVALTVFIFTRKSSVNKTELLQEDAPKEKVLANTRVTLTTIKATIDKYHQEDIRTVRSNRWLSICFLLFGLSLGAFGITFAASFAGVRPIFWTVYIIAIAFLIIGIITFYLWTKYSK